jgi:hypothetical protein
VADHIRPLEIMRSKLVSLRNPITGIAGCCARHERPSCSAAEHVKYRFIALKSEQPPKIIAPRSPTGHRTRGATA